MAKPIGKKGSTENHNKMANICKGMNYDIKHGVTYEEVISFVDKVRSNSSFLHKRNHNYYVYCVYSLCNNHMQFLA